MVERSDVAREIVRWMELFTVRSMREWSRFVRGSELSLAQFGILMRLYYGGGCGLSDISRYTGVTTAAVSQLVDKMVERQLVERTEDPADRRAKNINLSPKGRELVKASIGKRYHWVDQLAADLTAEEKNTVLEALPFLIESFQKLPVNRE